MYFDEDLVLDLRLNLLDKYVDYFVIVESKYNHKGEPKKLNFNIKNFKKFDLLACMKESLSFDIFQVIFATKPCGGADVPMP